jgi:AraC-like DNA-binding protein
MRLLDPATRDPAVTYALEAFAESRPPSIAAVVDRTGMSARRFIAAFRDQVGLTPKLACRLGRFRRVIAALGPTAPVDWTRLALDCGYFDQAHFNHEFREFAGVSPGEYLRDRTTSPNHVR